MLFPLVRRQPRVELFLLLDVLRNATLVAICVTLLEVAPVRVSCASAITLHHIPSLIIDLAELDWLEAKTTFHPLSRQPQFRVGWLHL